MQQNKLIVITGPTAVGKTALSIAIAKLYSCPIISADSRQFFKEMNIGTAKPTLKEMQGVTHYFVNSHSINTNYNVGNFEKEAIQLLTKLFQTHHTIIMVGGSGLYINAVCNGVDDLPEADAIVREKINLLYKTGGIEGLQKKLNQLDPDYYNQVDLQNPQRLTRALEVCILTSKPYSTLRKEKLKIRDFKTIKIGLTTARQLLYERINMRVDEMITNGLVQEVESLLPFKHLNALQTVGYKELFEFMDLLKHTENTIDVYNLRLKDAIDLIKQNTRRYAKRQLTWFRKDKDIKWFEPQDLDAILNYIKSVA